MKMIVSLQQRPFGHVFVMTHYHDGMSTYLQYKSFDKISNLTFTMDLHKHSNFPLNQIDIVNCVRSNDSKHDFSP